MNDRSLSRELATNVVEGLKAQGHILVVKGGVMALVREIDELMSPRLATIGPRLGVPRAFVAGEVTSTFGDEAIDEAVEEMVADMTRALMDSDHVEDVFAEDNVIRRDIFRGVRDALLDESQNAEAEDVEENVVVKLDTLGYVAATVARGADQETLKGALERAAAVAEASLVEYAETTREATFSFEGGELEDARLELEEAIADELTDLVEQGLADLPSVDRSIKIGAIESASDLRRARAELDEIGKRALLAAGYAATWAIEGEHVLVNATPFSEQDAENAGAVLAAFEREVTTAFAAVEPPRSVKAPKSVRAEPEPAPRSTKTVAAAKATKTKPAAAKPAAKKSAPKKAAPKKAAAKKAPAKKAVAKKAVAKKSAKKR